MFFLKRKKNHHIEMNDVFRQQKNKRGRHIGYKQRMNVSVYIYICIALNIERGEVGRSRIFSRFQNLNMK